MFTRYERIVGILMYITLSLIYIYGWIGTMRQSVNYLIGDALFDKGALLLSIWHVVSSALMILIMMGIVWLSIAYDKKPTDSTDET